MTNVPVIIVHQNNNHITKKKFQKIVMHKKKIIYGISCYTKHVKISYQWVLQWWKIVLSKKKKSLKIFDKKKIVLHYNRNNI